MSITSTISEALGMNSEPELDGDMQGVLDALDRLGGRPIEILSPDAAREQPTPADAVKSVMIRQGKNTQPQAVGKRYHISITGQYGDIPLHVYTPEGDGPFPIIVYFHGGGFVIADTQVYDATPRALCNGAEAIVISVDYHRAPEYPFPAAPDDAFVAYQWILQNTEQFNGIPGKVAVAGESAGGNLATVVALKARDHGIALPLHQLLIYPVVDDDFNRASYLENADAQPLNVAMMHWFFKHYDADPDSPYALPMKADSLAGLPPATVITAEADPLHSEGAAYAERLQQYEVPVCHQHYEGVAHEFFGMAPLVEKAAEAQEFASERLRRAFA